MEMGLGKRSGMDWIPKIYPVKGSSSKSDKVALLDTVDSNSKYYTELYVH